jgi:hypothetical protein
MLHICLKELSKTTRQLTQMLSLELNSRGSGHCYKLKYSAMRRRGQLYQNTVRPSGVVWNLRQGQVKNHA